MDERVKITTMGHVGKFEIGMLVALRHWQLQSIHAAKPLNAILTDDDTRRLGQTPNAVWRLDSVNRKDDRESAWPKYGLRLTMMADGSDAGSPTRDYVRELAAWFGEPAQHVPETNGWVGVERWIKWKRPGAGMLGLGCWVLLVQRDDDCPPCWRDDHPEDAPECLERWETGWPIRDARTKAEAIQNAALGMWDVPVVHMADCDLVEQNPEVLDD